MKIYFLSGVYNFQKIEWVLSNWVVKAHSEPSEYLGIWLNKHWIISKPEVF